MMEVTASAITVNAMTIVATHPKMRSSAGSTNSPIMSLRRVISIMVTITGTATMPLMTALQNSALIGSIAVKFSPAPTTVATAIVP